MWLLNVDELRQATESEFWAVNEWLLSLIVWGLMAGKTFLVNEDLDIPSAKLWPQAYLFAFFKMFLALPFVLELVGKSTS